MLIWILALVLLGIAGACGYKLGAVRFAVSLVGLILAAALASPMAPLMSPLVKMLGLKNPVWQVVLPPLVVFLLIYAIFIGLSFFVSRKVDLHFKYDSDETAHFRWGRVSRAVGLFIGLMTGAVWLLFFGLIIYVAGYLSVQVSTDQTSSTLLRLVSQAREDLQSTGLDKAVAPFDPMPQRYYQAADILGLVYQNPILVGRLSQYPPFVLVADRPEFQELAKDTEFNQMLLTKADALEIWKNPKVQAVVQNSEIIQELLSQDLTDLRTYLETGVSPKYADEKILGKWKLDPYASMAQERKRHPDMSSTEMRRLRVVMMEIMPGISLVATTDKKLTLKAEGVNEKLAQLLAPPQPKAVAAPQQAGTPSLNPQLAQRYGIQRGQQQRANAAAPAVPVAAPKANALPYTISTAQGTWERDGDKYQIKTQDDKGKTETATATADEERLTVYLPNINLVFIKAD